MSKKKSDKELRADHIAVLRQEQKDFCAAFSTASGKRTLEKLEDMFFGHESTMPPDHNPIALACNEGARCVVQYIKSTMVKDLGKLEELE